MPRRVFGGQCSALPSQELFNDELTIQSARYARVVSGRIAPETSQPG